MPRIERRRTRPSLSVYGVTYKRIIKNTVRPIGAERRTAVARGRGQGKREAQVPAPELWVLR